MTSITKIRIPKGNGSYRLIYCPSGEDKARLKLHLPYLEERYRKLDLVGSNYAFLKFRNCALHARQHIGFQYTLSVDIKDFFDSVRRSHVVGLIKDNVIEDCFVDGAPRQGLPTSPLIASIALLDADRRILFANEDCGISARYTRYADDLVFSFNEKEFAESIVSNTTSILNALGFRLNEKKQSLQSAGNGRRIVTGIAVDESGIHPTRKTRRKMRAALHQQNESSYSGLFEWAKCKNPTLDSFDTCAGSEHRGSQSVLH